jgi:hypothetical protein
MEGTGSEALDTERQIRQDISDRFALLSNQIHEAHAALVRRLKSRGSNSAGFLPGVVRAFDGKTKATGAAYITAFIEAYRRAGRLPTPEEEDRTLQTLRILTAMVCNHGIEEMERAQRLTGSHWGVQLDAARSALRRRADITEGDLARELRLALADLRAELPSDPAPPTIKEALSENSLARDGASWLWTYGGKTTSIRHSTGMTYLAKLLQRPGEDMHALDLSGARVIETDLGPVVDREALADYHRRLSSIDGDISEAEATGNADQAERLRTDRSAMLAEMGRAIGKGGKIRREEGSKKKVRQSVSLAVRRAIEQIRVLHPALAAHLKLSVRTGTLLGYFPSPRIGWVVRA